jgi:hypothetical protein
MAHAKLPLALLVTLSLGSGALADAPQDVAPRSETSAPEFSAEKRAAARKELIRRLEGADVPRERMLTTGRIAFVERPGGALQQIAQERFWRVASGADGIISILFDEATPDARVEILDRYRERWDVLGRGVSGKRSNMVRDGMLDRNPRVRRAAARLAATRPFPHLVHHAIDAALVYPELTLAAVLSVARNGDHRGCRWALEAGARRGDPVRKAALYAFRRAGAPCKERIAEYLDAEDEDRRLLAAEGVLQLAAPGDEATLREWAERWRDQHPEMASRFEKAADELEDGLYQPPEPEPVEVGFPEG